MNKILIWFLKGFFIGALQGIPGLSVSSLAYVSEIYERLVNSIGSLNLKNAGLLFHLKFKSFIKETDLIFLMIVIMGIVSAIFSVSFLLVSLFEIFPIYLWSFFFGFILASVYIIGKKNRPYNISSIFSFIIGFVIPIGIYFIQPMRENSNLIFLFFCGFISAGGFIIPGISFSNILIFTGSFQVIMIRSVNDFNTSVWIVFIIGFLTGFPLFIYSLKQAYRKYKTATYSLLLGLLMGSSLNLWPWKHDRVLTIKDVEVFDVSGKPVITGYDVYFPDSLNFEVLISIAMVISGFLLFWFIDRTIHMKYQMK